MTNSPSRRPGPYPARLLAGALALAIVVVVVQQGTSSAEVTRSTRPNLSVSSNRIRLNTTTTNNNNNNNSSTTPTTEAPKPTPRAQPKPADQQQARQGSSAATLVPATANNNRQTNANLERRRSVGNGSSSALSSDYGGATLGDFVEDELPPDFYEMPAEQLDLGMNATGRAPTPILNVAVLQNGQVIDSAINVHPGTPLEMVIYLDDKSAKVYGLLVSFLKVQDDTFRNRNETIILNGCPIDTYIFGNFEHYPEDRSLRAKFRAFKFPDSNFVRFVGTVNVCIEKCERVNCNGSNGNGAANNNEATNTVSRRKRRSSKQQSGADQHLVAINVSTLLRVSFD